MSYVNSAEKRRSCDAGHIGFFERHKIHARAAQLRDFLRHQLQQLVGQPQHFRIRRISPIKEQRFVEADQRAGIGEARAAQVVEEVAVSAACSTVPKARLEASSRSRSIGSRLSEAMRLSLTAFAFLLLHPACRALGQDTKLYVVTHVDLTPNYSADGNKLLQQFASDSRKDKGVVRFELLRRSIAEEPFHNGWSVGESGRLRRAPGGESHQTISRKVATDAGKSF